MSTLGALVRSIAFVLAVAACAAPSVVVPSPPPAVPVTQPEQALARVIDKEPRLRGIQPLAPDAIGQAAWYQVAPGIGRRRLRRGGPPGMGRLPGRLHRRTPLDLRGQA